MKKILLLLSAVALFWACGKTEPVAEPGAVAPTAITVSPENISAPQKGGEFTLTVTSPSRPNVSDKPEWVTVQDGIYNKDTYKITLTIKVAAYGEYGSRSGELTLSAGNLSKTLTVTQEGRVKPELPDTDISTTLVTDGATTEAQALYSFLLSNYGRKMVSGIMANVNWNHTEADNVFKATGKYPALNCYDFIHILYSGANWINYSDITPVKEWADAGGIVALMWHFNVPATSGSSSDQVTCTPGDGTPIKDKDGKITGYTTLFRAKNVFTEGSWEHEWFYDQMDKVAEVILKLQEAGIAAIWRPFHEAAGNYYALKWSGAAWFWWGYDGPDIYKRLWNAMQDYFYSKGIRNLIWVWTAQDYNGDPSSYGSDADYYPGDDRVDIVGRDIYGQGPDHNTQEFISAQTAYPKKMIALSENGKNGNVEYGLMSEVWAAGALWSWFMPWYGSNMPGSSWWQDALNCDNIITREDMPSLK